jgi:hypothetical protein
MSKKKASTKMNKRPAAKSATKSGGTSKSASAKRPSAPKPVAMPPRAAAAPGARAQREIEAAKYTPTPIEGIGWKPFRYPPV